MRLGTEIMLCPMKMIMDRFIQAVYNLHLNVDYCSHFRVAAIVFVPLQYIYNVSLLHSGTTKILNYTSWV